MKISRNGMHMSLRNVNITHPNLYDYTFLEQSPNFIKYSPKISSENTADPLVSIITISLNKEDTIERTIQSVIGQTYPFIEYIVIDGNSSDGTMEILQKYIDRISIILRENDKGISDAFNKGVYLSNGNILGIINSDDWYEPNAVELAVESWRKNGEGIY